MTRLVQLMAGARHGGAEAFFTRMAIALQRAGQDQRVAIRRDKGRAATLREGGVEPVELPFGGRFDLTTRFGLPKLMRDFQPDIVLSWMNRATSLTPRGGYVHAARLGGYYDLKYYRRAQHLIGNTKHIVTYLTRSGWPAANAHYLPNFVDADPAPPVPRATLDTPDHATLLLAMGRLHPVKGFDVLLHALAQLPNAFLWLAGEGPEREALTALAVQLGVADRVRLLGWRSDTAALLAAADILVCPSRHEPLGNVVIEAWAHGVPVIASNAAGPAALITANETGLLVPIEDADAIAHSVTILMGNKALYGTLAEAGVAAFWQSYTEQAVVAAYQDFFQRVTS